MPSLGTYPDTSLKEARERREQARKLLSDSVDPSLQRMAIRESQTHEAADSFKAIAREWFEKYSQTWVKSQTSRIISRLERDIFPRSGTKPIQEVGYP